MTNISYINHQAAHPENLCAKGKCNLFEKITAVLILKFYIPRVGKIICGRRSIVKDKECNMSFSGLNEIITGFMYFSS